MQKNQSLAWHIQLLNHFALVSTTRKAFLENGNGSETVIDQMINILKIKSLIKSVENNEELYHADVALTSYAITLLYNLAFEKKIFYDLKSKDVKTVCEQLFKAKDKTIQFASRTLAATLNQEYIDEIESPSKVAYSFLYFIENTIDDLTLTYHGIKLDGIITNLEAIVQNDDVKEEIVNDDDGIPLIARCTYEPYLDLEKIRRPALRIIDTLSFTNETAVEKIEADDKLMEHIEKLSKSNDEEQIPIVNRLLWKVDGEHKFIAKIENEIKRRRKQVKRVFDEKTAIYQYIPGDYRFVLVGDELLEKFDITISFCKDNKEICEKIYRRLQALDKYNISFDENNKFYSHPEKMAQTIERSSIIIICLSKEYQSSNQCHLEAEYARKRKRTCIFVKVDPQYKPTGWLEKYIDNESIFDLTDREFNVGFTKLVDETDDINERLNKN